jgi:monofunctional biosynthetic peptidoglycan transglycosylase
VALRHIGRFVIGAMVAAFATVAYTWLTMPDIRPLKTTSPTVTAFMQIRAREAEAAGKPVRRRMRWVSYDHIAPDLKRAVLAAEDAAFFQHEGIDWDEVRASIKDTLRKGEPLRGASTITQQLAKNLYLSSSRNPYRKLKELFITRRLEAELPKRRILELYLNVIEWGDGIWGCETAAVTYFGVPASALSLDQATLLAAAVSSPRVFNPARPSARLLYAQRLILRRMGGAPK